MRDEREISDLAGSTASKAVGQGDIRLKIRLPGNRKHQVVVTDALQVQPAQNVLSQ
jgi:hypothetical protein